MKTSSYFQLIVIFVMLFIVSSCKTNLVDAPALQSRELSIEEAKSWYISKFGTEANTRQEAARAGNNGQDEIRSKVPWKQTQILKGYSNNSMIITPVLYEGSKRPGVIISDETTPTEQKSAVKANIAIVEEWISVSLNKKGEKVATRLQFISNETKGGKIINKSKELKKFDGWIVVRDMKGDLLEGIELDHGKIVRNFNTKSADRARLMNCISLIFLNQTVSIESCGPNCASVTVTQSSFSQYVCLGSSGAPSNQEYMPYFEYDSQGSILPVQAVVDLDLSSLETHPCLLGLVGTALTVDPNRSKNTFEYLVNHYYGGPNSATLKLALNPNLNYYAGTLRADPNNVSSKLTIFFKPTAIESMTKEYAVAIILHEFQHAIYATDDPFAFKYPNANSEHLKMVESALNLLADELVRVTGISQYDARAITLVGLKDIYDNPSTQNYFINRVQAQYGNNFNISQAFTRGEQFRNYNENATNGTNNKACP